MAKRSIPKSLKIPSMYDATTDEQTRNELIKLGLLTKKEFTSYDLLNNPYQSHYWELKKDLVIKVFDRFKKFVEMAMEKLAKETFSDILIKSTLLPPNEKQTFLREKLQDEIESLDTHYLKTDNEIIDLIIGDKTFPLEPFLLFYQNKTKEWFLSIMQTKFSEDFHFAVLHKRIAELLKIEIGKTEIENNYKESKENPYPRIFINANAYQNFIELKKIIVREKYTLADYSFIYRKMWEDKYIYPDIKEKAFRDWLWDEFNIEIFEPLKTISNCSPEPKIRIYSRIINSK